MADDLSTLSNIEADYSSVSLMNRNNHEEETHVSGLVGKRHLFRQRKMKGMSRQVSRFY